MADKTPKFCWVIDLAAVSKSQSGRFADACQRTLSAAFGGSHAVGVVRGQLENENDDSPRNPIQWFRKKTFNRCVRELLHPEGQVCEVLVVVLPDGVQGGLERVLTLEFLRYLDPVLMVADRLADREPFLADLLLEGGRPETLDTALRRVVTLAEWVGRVGQAILFAPPANQNAAELDDWSFSIEASTDIAELDSPERVGFQQYLLTALGTDLFGFHPRFGDSSPSQMLIENERVSKSWGRLSRTPYRDIYYQWYRQEFGSRRIGEVFTNACKQSLLVSEEATSSRRQLLPVPVQHAIGTCRMCRRLATWTLEGVPFDCTVVLLSDKAMASLSGVSTNLSSLIDIRPPTPFNLRNIAAVRRHAELAQSEGLYMLVSAVDGCLYGVGMVRGGKAAPEREMRIAFYSFLGEMDALVFDIRPQGQVTLYGKEGPLLDYDGFEWKASPTAWLARTLNEFLTNADGSTKANSSAEGMTASQAARCSDRLTDAARLLVERSESSIFVLLDASDVLEGKKLASEPLRPEVRWSFSEMVPISNLGTETLAGLLHLDGAHLIGRDGNVTSISRRISVRPFRDQIGLKKKQVLRIREWLKDIPDDASSDLREIADWFRQSLGQSGDGEKATLRVYKRVREVHLDAVAQMAEDQPAAGTLPQKVLKKLQRTVDRDAPLRLVADLTELTDRAIVRLKKKLQKRWSCHGLQYSSRHLMNGDQAVRALLLTHSVSAHSETPEEQRQTCKDHCQKICGREVDVRLVRLHEEFFQFDEERLLAQPHWPSGLAIQEPEDGRSACVWIEESCIDDRIEGRRWKGDSERSVDFLLPDFVRQPLMAWQKSGSNPGTQSPGTGARAATELSRQLPKSLIVKVSASGSFSVFRGGKPLHNG